MTDNERNFIIELEALSRKYKLQIYGCGCCGSPSVDPIEEKELVSEAGYIYEDKLEWVEPDHCYWDERWDGARPYKSIVVGKERT